MKGKPDLSDISLRKLTERHVKAGYSNVYKYALVLEAELEGRKEAMRVNTDFKLMALELEADNTRLTEALERIAQWAKAYPLDVFPEPDFKNAAKVLTDAGMTLDAISASNMRHVVEGVGQIAKEALAAKEEA